MYATLTEAAQASTYYAAEARAIERRLDASKRYRGRANDVRALAAATERWRIATDEAQAFEDAERAEAERAAEQLQPLFPDAPFTGDEATARVETLARLDAAFRTRVAERAYYMALNGEGTSDEERWLWAEGFERGVDIAARHAEGEWHTPSQRRRVERMAGLH